MANKVADSSGGRGRKRKRQVSWAAAELLEEVKFFNMGKPVNPSIPPPMVDDGGEDAASQPGVELLGLLGVESSSSSSTSASAFSTAPPSSSPLVSTSTISHATIGAAAIANGGGNFRSATTLAQLPSDGQGQGGSSNTSGGDGVGGAEGAAATGRTAGGSRLFKGFEKTETVVRRKKQVAPPPPPPGTPPPLPPPGEGAHLTHRYPKDMWPGHKPPNHVVGGGAGDEGGAAEEEPLEFFCDSCDETIPNGFERMECAVCPDEFCLCLGCYDEGEVLDKRHEHELLPSAAPFHVTRAAPSAKAALEAAKALHVSEAQHGEDSPYDDDDLG